MELRKVATEADDDSTDSLDGRYTDLIDSEKATIDSQFLDDNDDAESQKFLSNGMMKKKKYEECHEEYHPGHTSFGMSVFNLSNAIMGSGILGLSFAMANTGIVLFTVLLIAVAILSLYSVHLLLVTAKEGGSLIYEKLGERAFGWPGKMAAFGSITMQNIGAMSSYLFIVKYELPEVIRAFLGLEEITGEWYLNGNYLVVFVSIGVILPLSLLKNLGYLGYTSGFSLSCMVFFLGVVTCFLISFLYFISSSQTAYTVPILAFAFVCHPEVLPIYSELKDRSRRKMQSVSNLSILAMLVMYMLSALFGYLTFYDNVEAELLHTFTKVYKFDTMLLLVRLAVLTAVTLTVPIVLFPVSLLRTNTQSFSWTRHMLIAAAILAFNNMLVIFVPTIRDIFGFIGSSAATMLIFILPAAFYIRLVKSLPFRSWQKIGVRIQDLTHPPAQQLSHYIIFLSLSPSKCDPSDISTDPSGASSHTQPHVIPPSLSLQATIFLVVGIIFMIGSLSLIVLDWVHNPPGSNSRH
uniref:Sodium-coupled neutral amino acid transporter 4-like n=1 Tax=Echeneis naucrates TaxID=173247 RepID=A0A665V9D8_ECHNA